MEYREVPKSFSDTKHDIYLAREVTRQFKKNQVEQARGFFLLVSVLFTQLSVMNL